MSYISISSLNISNVTDNESLPSLITPKNGGSLQAHLQEIQQLVENTLHKTGGILFRGFDTGSETAFQEFARSFGSPLLNYEFGSTPRTALKEGVYTATEYPSHQVIPLHNEQAYTLSWPMKIWFHCITAAQSGGETPIADSRKIYNLISPSIRQRFEDKKLRYVRNYGNGLDLPWQSVFATDDKMQVEAFCKQNNIYFEWKNADELRTSQICQGVARHPRTQEMVWFNQAHLFHVSNLQPHVREALLAVVEEQDLPRNVYYGDGSPIEESILAEIRSVLDECTVKFSWQAGDVMMLDNMLTAHGRSTFSGPRKVVVAMAEAHQ